MGDGSETPKNALLLCGGGSRGAIEVGFYRALQELKIPIDLVIGTSVGAINGAAIASGIPWKDLAKFWCSIRSKQLFHFDWKILSQGMKANGLYIPAGLKNFLSRHLPIKRFEDLKIPFLVTGTDLQTGKIVVFKEGDLIEALMASISIPGIFPPVLHQGRYVIDGGLTGILPIKPAIDYGAKTILAMRCECRTPTSRPPSGLRDILIRSFAITLEAKHETDLIIYEPQVKMVVIEPCFDIEVDFLDFSHSEELIGLSYELSKKELEKAFAPQRGSSKGNALEYCFCEVPQEDLFRLAKQKFIEGRATEELMRQAHSERERKYIATVALMDVEEDELRKLIRGGEKDLSHIFACRDRVVSVLKGHGIDCHRGICRTQEES